MNHDDSYESITPGRFGRGGDMFRATTAVFEARIQLAYIEYQQTAPYTWHQPNERREASFDQLANTRSFDICHSSFLVTHFTSWG